MDETLKKIGLELQRRYVSAVRSRIDWRMIDAVTRLQEREEAEAPSDDSDEIKPCPPQTKRQT